MDKSEREKRIPMLEARHTMKWENPLLIYCFEELTMQH